MTTISADGATTTIYIQQTEAGIAYKMNAGGDLTAIESFPISIVNSNATPAGNVLKVLFETDLTLTDNDHRFWVQSSGIQFGDTSLPPSGTKRTITVDGVTDYIGLIDSSAQWDSVFVYNLHVTTANGTTLASYGGWIGQMNYAAGCTNHFIVNCSSDGDIPMGGGGIVGSNSAYLLNADTTDLTITGCWSSGSIASGAGGIAGDSSGLNGGLLTIQYCSSSGAITNGGGIVGDNAGIGGGYVDVSRCYSTGAIGNSSGGIFGSSAGMDTGTAIATDCYSRGDIYVSSGGIFGRMSGSASANNCYTTGAIGVDGQAGGIYGEYSGGTANACYVSGMMLAGSGYIFMDGDTIPSGCYSEAANEGTGWNTLNAQMTLNITSIYISTGINQPYEFRDFGPSPYSLTTTEGEIPLVNFIQSIPAGTSTSGGVLAGVSSYSILEIDNNPPDLSPDISINSTTGVISTTSAILPGYPYFVVVRAEMDTMYSITTFTIIVTEAPPTPAPPPAPIPSNVRGKGYDFTTYTATQVGNILVRERLESPNRRFNSFEEYTKYLKSRSSLA